MTSSYFSGANAVIAVFDVANAESFAAVPQWLEEAKTFTEKYGFILFACLIPFSLRRLMNITFFIIGNKSDLPERQVSREQAETFALANSAVYLEVR
jgi:Ras-related protein Rab-2A